MKKSKTRGERTGWALTWTLLAGGIGADPGRQDGSNRVY
jgi:hypothetical protein